MKKLHHRFIIPLVASFSLNTYAAQEELVLDSCFVDGVKSEALCGVLEVAENRTQPMSEQNKLPLNIVVLPKYKEESKALPLVVLAGGPGQAATELAGMLNRPLWNIRQQHDIILVDQRGTGKSNGLRCETPEVDAISFDNDSLDMEQEVAKCLTQFEKYHLPSYSTYDFIEDLEQVREALGHEQVHILGGSYGTRSGFAYLKNHPESIKTATLDSNAPMDIVIGFFGKTSEAAFELLVEDCKAHEHCNKAFPELKQDYLSLMAKLEDQNIEEPIYHPITGKKETLLLSKSKVTENLRGLLYNLGSRQLLPYAVHSAANGDYRTIASLIASSAVTAEQNGGLYTGLTMNIICNEDLPRAKPEDFTRDADNYFNGELGYTNFTDVCKNWPKWPAPENFAQPVKTDVPVLLFSGKYDPVTPPEYAELAMPHLTNAKHVVVEKGSHFPSVAMCTDAIEDFLEKGDLAEIDFSCAEQEVAEMFLIDLNQVR